MPYGDNIGGMRGGTGNGAEDLQSAAQGAALAISALEQIHIGFAAVDENLQSAQEFSTMPLYNVGDTLDAVRGNTYEGAPMPGFSESVSNKAEHLTGALVQQVENVV